MELIEQSSSVVCDIQSGIGIYFFVVDPLIDSDVCVNLSMFIALIFIGDT